MWVVAHAHLTLFAEHKSLLHRSLFRPESGLADLVYWDSAAGAQHSVDDNDAGASGLDHKRDGDRSDRDATAVPNAPPDRCQNTDLTPALAAGGTTVTPSIQVARRDVASRARHRALEDDGAGILRHAANLSSPVTVTPVTHAASIDNESFI